MKKLLTLLLAAGLFAGGYAVGSRKVRSICEQAQAAATLAVGSVCSPTFPGVDLSALQAVNEDVVGWITVPDTSLSYPLLQGEDNEYYLNRSWQGVYSPGGSIFMEHRCPADFSGFSTIVYGHRMSRDTMFNSLRRYSEPEYLAEHPDIYVITEDYVRIYRVFAVCEASVSAPVYRLVGEQKEYRQDIIDFCMVNSAVKTGLWPTTEGRILVLSTCTGINADDYRWVVAAMETAVIPR